MNEEIKIQSVIEEYQDYLNKTNSDVCHSIKGVWFFFQYDSKNNIYECFYQFFTADELERIIIGEIIESINIALECTAEEIVFANGKRPQVIDVDSIPTNYDFADRINELAVNIQAIKKTMHLVDDAYQAMLGIMKKTNEDE